MWNGFRAPPSKASSFARTMERHLALIAEQIPAGRRADFRSRPLPSSYWPTCSLHGHSTMSASASAHGSSPRSGRKPLSRDKVIRRTVCGSQSTVALRQGS